MILDKTVLVSLSGENVKYYESLGYNIPRVTVKDGRKDRAVVRRGTKILVRIEDLQNRSKTNVNVQCDYCGDTFVRQYQLIMIGRKNSSKDACKKCMHIKSGESKKVKYDFVKQAFDERGYVLLTKEDEISSLVSDKLSYLCPKHGVKLITWNNFSVGGAGCNECGFESAAEKIRMNTWNKIIKEFQNSQYKLLSNFDEYTGSDDCCLRLLCEKHGEFFVSWSNYKRYCGCPICNSSIGERRIVNFLNVNDIMYEKPKRFDGLVGIGGKKLSYDFYLPTYNLLIEYQGAQHGEPGHFGNATDEENIDQFLKQQEHYKRKREYAENNNYNLLEIWHYDFHNIEKILSDVTTIQN